ncbi:hypothetical protein Rsub_13145 [Raphidocelis subcapitata]|uniref:Pherophorin domain-containing protein n=1 Tax=Raphidocelis subcapitata TaxID=307507 RepID=A0A2V0PQ91_9CHLO|nr:hypothetical protein Rsub_13145 [Raphidocelis subcapitata]|eukprot:GBG00231.1 hypothetical protein Rsub_13145 [Raphidocelis subcapitata]
MRAAALALAAALLLAAAADAAPIACPADSFMDAPTTSYRVTFDPAGSTETRACFSVTAGAQCAEDNEKYVNCCLTYTEQRPKFTSLVISGAAPACAVKKQSALKVRWAVGGGGGAGRAAKGDGGSTVTVPLSRLPLQGGKVCADFSASTDPGCKSILQLCRGGLCNYKLTTRPFKRERIPRSPCCIASVAPVAQGACANATCPPPGECERWRACDTETGACTAFGPKPDGTACGGGVCQGGACIPSDLCAGQTCQPANECETGGPGACDPTTGDCAFQSKANGTACGGGSCRGGVCTATPDLCAGKTCGPPGECQWGQGTCNNATGECSWRNKGTGAACSFGTCLWGACTEVVTFDDITPGPPPAPYRRLIWDNALVVAAAQYNESCPNNQTGAPPGGAGFSRAAVSAPNILYNSEGTAIVVSAANASRAFSLRGLHITAGWRDGLDVALRAIAPDGRERPAFLVSVGTSGSLWVELIWNADFRGIVGFTVEAAGGRLACPGAAEELDAPFFAIDNLRVSHH